MRQTGVAHIMQSDQIQASGCYVRYSRNKCWNFQPTVLNRIVVFSLNLCRNIENDVANFSTVLINKTNPCSIVLESRNNKNGGTWKFTRALYTLSLYIFTKHFLNIRQSTSRPSKLSLSLRFAKGNIRICHFLHTCSVSQASHIFFFILSSECTNYELQYATSFIRVTAIFGPWNWSYVIIYHQKSIHIVNLHFNWQVCIKEERIEWCRAFLLLPKERVLSCKFKATTGTSYKWNTAYTRVWHQFRAEYNE